MGRTILVALALLWLCAPTGATPEEDVARLEGEVAALKAEVAALRAEVAALRAAVAGLPAEARSGEAPPAPPPEESAPPPAEAPPAPPPEEPAPPPAEAPSAPPEPAAPPAPGPSGDGTFTLDRALYAADLERDRIARLRTILDGIPEADRGRYLSVVREQVARDSAEAMLKLVLRADGTWAMEAGFEGLLSTAEGTFRRDGERLFLHRARLNGADSPEDREAVWKDDRITLPPLFGQAIPLTLPRQG